MKLPIYLFCYFVFLSFCQLGALTKVNIHTNFGFYLINSVKF